MASPDRTAHLVDRALRRLAMPRAPHTLLPRVMKAVDEWARRPWYTREWRAWPSPWRVASIVLAGLLAAAAGAALPAAENAAAALAAAGRGPEIAAAAADLAANAVRGVSVAATLWQALVEPVALYMFVTVVLLWLACAAFATALGRVVLGKAVPL